MITIFDFYSSRGDGCANFNKPGIYTAVKNFLPWIQGNIDED